MNEKSPYGKGEFGCRHIFSKPRSKPLWKRRKGMVARGRKRPSAKPQGPSRAF